MPSGRVTIGVLILGFFGVRPPLAASPANGTKASDVTACQRQKNRLRHAPATPAGFIFLTSAVFGQQALRLQQTPFFSRRSGAAFFTFGVRSGPKRTKRGRGGCGVHAVAPRRANSVIAALGMRLLPGRISTQGKAPSRSNLQIVVLEMPKSSAACRIVSNRRSPGSVAPSISPDKMRSTRRSTPGFAANIALSLCSVVMGEFPFMGCLFFLTLPQKCPVCVLFPDTLNAPAPAFSLA